MVMSSSFQESESELSPNKFRLLPLNASFVNHSFREDVYQLLCHNGFPPTYFTRNRVVYGPHAHYTTRVVAKRQRNVLDRELVRYEVDNQKAFVRAFLTAKYFDPMVVAVVGRPSDYYAMTSLTSLVLKRYDKNGMMDVDTMYCINSVHPCDRLIHFLDRPRVLVVHNIHPKATGNRLVNVRDILSVFSTTLRFVVVLSNDPELFIKSKLYMDVDLVLNFNDKKILA